jgi:uncharacterized protein (DUF2267 family)
MNEHEVVLAVREISGLDNAQHAVDATRATLTVLSTRLTGQGSANLPVWLPAGIAEALPEPGQGATFGVEEFYRRVAYEEGRGCTADAAREHARAVIAALKAHVSEDEYADFVTQLPDDYRTDLLSTAPGNEHR